MQKKTKICIVYSVEFGYEKFVSYVAEQLVLENYDVTALFKWNDIENVPIHNGVKLKNFNFKRSSSLISLFLTTLKLFFYFKKEKFDVVQCMTPIASISSRLAAKLSGIKIIIYKVHGFYFHENMVLKVRLFHIFIEFILCKLTDYIFCVSKEDAQFAKTLGYLKANKIFHVSNGINHKQFSPVTFSEKLIYKKLFGLKEGSLTIGIVARVVKEKGFYELFHSFEELCLKYSNIQLFICGSTLKSDHDESMEEEILHLKNKFPDNVIWPGYVENTNLAYKAMDIFCLPSYREGMPMTILEAMMTGIPVLATDIRGSREIVINNQTGFICKPKDKLEFKNKLEKLIINNNLRNEFGNNGNKRALKFFTQEKSLETEIKLFKDITGNIE